MEEAEVLQLYELSYPDLVLVSSNNVSLSAAEELDKLQSTSKAIMGSPRACGAQACYRSQASPTPPLSVVDLLPLARKLALLNPNHRKTILKDHKLGSDCAFEKP
ncbi:hypothetical protein L3X38_045085 [Prunus dulcis]|uniref:Uncharacterized protein n=1 Tax=Prunus dulcis TaxID=3755 RepID=A0AAD4YP14_PRUDU|nr:hypothetical protein L3X38_045085 [Prunus dulcis]